MEETEHHTEALEALRTAIDILSHASSTIEAVGFKAPSEWCAAAHSVTSQVLALMTGAGLWRPSPPIVRISNGCGSTDDLTKLDGPPDSAPLRNIATEWAVRYTNKCETPFGQRSSSTSTSCSFSSTISSPEEVLSSVNLPIPELSSLPHTQMSKLSNISRVANGNRNSPTEALGNLKVDVDKSEVESALITPPKPSSHFLLHDVKALLIDLDGTMYTPTGLIPGADAFYAYLLRNRVPFVFLSNTGSKGPEGVQAKLMARGLMFGAARVPLNNIYTAAQAQCAYMLDHIPHGGRLFVVAGAAEASGDAVALQQTWWMKLLSTCAADGKESTARRHAELLRSWQIRTVLAEEETVEWAAAASAHLDNQCVFVVLFTDGQISSTIDPQTGRKGHDDWSFETIKQMSCLLSHGAEFVCTAEDSFNPTKEGFPLPGPGMFSAMFRKLMYPLGRGRLHICGKGGGAEEGGRYMMGRAVEMLRKQGFDGELHDILIVGDRFDTDIRAGMRAGLTTCLVETGCHSHDLQNFYPADSAHFVAASVAHLLPPNYLEEGVLDCTTHPATESPGSSTDQLPRRSVPAQLPPLRAAVATPSSLRSWILARGNLIHASSMEAVTVPLIQRLREYFDSKDPSGTGYITIFDVFQALEELGIAPSPKTSARSQHPSPRGCPTIPGDVMAQTESRKAIASGMSGYHLRTFVIECGSGSSAIDVSSLARVTFRQLCREVQHCMNMSAEDLLGESSERALSIRSLRSTTVPAFCKFRSATTKAKAVAAFSKLPSPSRFCRPSSESVPPMQWKKRVPPLPELLVPGMPGVEAEEESSLFGSQTATWRQSSPRWVSAGGLCSPTTSDCSCSSTKPSPLAATTVR